MSRPEVIFWFTLGFKFKFRIWLVYCGCMREVGRFVVGVRWFVDKLISMLISIWFYMTYRFDANTFDVVWMYIKYILDTL